MSRLTHRFPIAALALALAAPGLAAAQDMPGTAMQVGTTRLDLSVTGTATRTPDLATISAGVMAQDVDSAVAMDTATRKMERVMAALRRAGIADKDIQTSNLSLSPNYRYAQDREPQLVNYQASTMVTIKFRDMRRAGAIISALTREGANQINGPSFSIEKPQAALDEARMKALAEGRERAALYARGLGLRVLRAVSISENGSYYAPPPPPPMAMMERGAVMVTGSQKDMVAPGSQDLQVTLAMVFELGR